MKRIAALLLVIFMALSLTACKKSNTTPADQAVSDTSPNSNVELFSKTDTNTGSITIVDKDGNAVSGYTVDENGKVLDDSGKIVTSTAQIDSYEKAKESSNVNTAEKEDKKASASAEVKVDPKKSESDEATTSNGATSTQQEKKPNGSGNTSTSSGNSNTTASKPSTDSKKPSSSSSTETPSKPVTPAEPAKPSTPTEPSKPTHTHSYSIQIVSPTCKSSGYTVHTCSCGDSYTDSHKDALGHDWKAQYKNVTVDDYEMIKVWRCSSCDGDVTKILKNNAGDQSNCPNCGKDPTLYGYYSSYEEVKVGSHTEKELVGYTCTRCGANK